YLCRYLRLRKLSHCIPEHFQLRAAERHQFRWRLIQLVPERCPCLETERGQHDELHPSIGRDSSSLGQSLLLEPIDHSCRVGCVAAPFLRQRTHRTTLFRIERMQGARVVGREVEFFKCAIALRTRVYEERKHAAPRISRDLLFGLALHELLYRLLYRLLADWRLRGH